MTATHSPKFTTVLFFQQGRPAIRMNKTSWRYCTLRIRKHSIAWTWKIICWLVLDTKKGKCTYILCNCRIYIHVYRWLIWSAPISAGKASMVQASIFKRRKTEAFRIYLPLPDPQFQLDWRRRRCPKSVGDTISIAVANDL